MVKLNNITIVTIPEGDWEGLYVNGELKMQSHEIRLLEDLSRHCPIASIEEFYFEDFNEGEGLPQLLKDIIGGNNNGSKKE